MGSTLSVTHLRGLTSGSNANEILLDSGHSIIGATQGAIYAPGQSRIIASGFDDDRSASYTSTETILTDTSYTYKFPKRKFLFFMGYSYYKSTGGAVDFSWRVGGSQVHRQSNYKNVTSDHANAAHYYLTSSTYTGTESVGIQVIHTGTTVLDSNDGYSYVIWEIAA